MLRSSTRSESAHRKSAKAITSKPDEQSQARRGNSLCPSDTLRNYRTNSCLDNAHRHTTLCRSGLLRRSAYCSEPPSSHLRKASREGIIHGICSRIFVRSRTYVLSCLSWQSHIHQMIRNHHGYYLPKGDHHEIESSILKQKSYAETVFAKSYNSTSASEQVTHLTPTRSKPRISKCRLQPVEGTAGRIACLWVPSPYRKRRCAASKNFRPNGRRRFCSIAMSEHRRKSPSAT